MSKDAAREKFMKQFRDTVAKNGNQWELWSDFVTWSSIQLDPHRNTASAAKQDEIVGKYDPGTIATLYTHMFQSLIENQEQDFMGHTYMELGLGEKSKGQDFTPYALAKLTAMLTMDRDRMERRLAETGTLVVYEPACGAGAMIMAADSCLGELRINRSKVLFVGQDLSELSVRMCHVQLSVLGIPAVLIQGDTLRYPASLIRQDGDWVLDAPNAAMVLVTPAMPLLKMK